MARGKSTKRGGGRGKKSSRGGGSDNAKGRMLSILNKGYSESVSQVNELSRISSGLRDGARSVDRKIDDVSFVLLSMAARQTAISDDILIVKQDVREELGAIYRILSQITNLNKESKTNIINDPSKPAETKMEEVDAKDGVKFSDGVRKTDVAKFEGTYQVPKGSDAFEILQGLVFELRAEPDFVRKNNLSGPLQKAEAAMNKIQKEAEKSQSIGGMIMDNSANIEMMRNSNASLILSQMIMPLTGIRRKIWYKLFALEKAAGSSTSGDDIRKALEELAKKLKRPTGTEQSSGWVSGLFRGGTVTSPGDIHSEIRKVSGMLRKRATALLTLKGYFSAASAYKGTF